MILLSDKTLFSIRDRETNVQKSKDLLPSAPRICFSLPPRQLPRNIFRLIFFPFPFPTFLTYVLSKLRHASFTINNIH